MNTNTRGGAAAAVRAFYCMRNGCGDHTIAYRTGLPVDEVRELREALVKLGMIDTEALPLDEVSHDG